MLATWGASRGFNPASLFSGGEQGAWYDPSNFGTMFQNAAGTTPVTAVEQAVGLILDQRVPVAQTGYYSGVFDGTGDYLSVLDSAQFDLNSTFTVQCWFYQSAAANAIILGRGGGASSWSTANGHEYLLLIESGVLYWQWNNAGSPTNISVSAPAAARWNHVAIGYNGTTTRVWLNGTSIGTSATAYTLPTTRNITRIGAAPSGGYEFNGYISNIQIVKGTDIYGVGNSTITVPTVPLTAVANTVLLTCQNSTFIDNSPNNFTITAVGDAKTGQRNPFGNHAFQTTDASRPTLRARYNLLTYSEQFDNAAWTQSGVTLTANAAVAPDGTTTAEQIAGTVANSLHRIFFTSGVTIISGTQLTYSCYLKANTLTRAVLAVGDNLDFRFYAAVNLSTGQITQTGVQSAAAGASYISSAIENVGSGWYRVTVTGTVANGQTIVYATVALSNSDTPGGAPTYAGTTDSIYAWGAQLLTAADQTSTGGAYQRIAAATDYVTVSTMGGAVFNPYLAFDGSDDSLLTNSVDFSGTDAMTVFAGVTKNSDAAQGAVVELSATIASNNGTFLLAAPDGATTTYGWDSKGTSQVDAVTSGLAAPTTNVVTGISDISDDSCIIRVNGTQADSDTGDQGTGNFGNYPLYIGRRNNASLPFNGRLYQLIVRGAASNASQIGGTEAFVASKCNATAPVFNVEYLVIAGGGSGGTNNGGAGGGAGGYRCNVPGESSGGGASAENSFLVLLQTPYTVTVGGGGNASTNPNKGNNGSNSVFASITSVGGGGGGSGGTDTSGNTGGSGGGSTRGSTIGSGTTNQGFNGGSSTGSSIFGTGGGGGAGQVGQTGTTLINGNGGDGVQSNITGTPTYRAGGGGGGRTDNLGSNTTGGLGGGGRGTGTADLPGSGTVNTGSGGGGTRNQSSGAGGSGIVIIKIPDSRTATFSSGVTSSVSTAVAGFKIYTVTATSTTSETVTFT